MTKKKTTKPSAVEKRQQQQKEQLIEILKKTPIIQVACQKIGMGRATYYRWLKEDSAFAEAASTALDAGVGIINDMAESQLISAIKDKHMTAIIFWLKNHHDSYRPRLELTNGHISDNEDLSPEQEESVRNALIAAGVLKEQPQKQLTNTNEK